MKSARTFAALLAVVSMPGATTSSLEADMELTMRALRAAATEVPPDPTHMSLPKVPRVVNAGSDGLPELPSVSSMLNAASETLTGINNQAAELQKKMLRVQKASQGRLEKRKAVFDHKLKEQEQKNKAVIASNAQVAKKIMLLKKNNEVLFKHAQETEKTNEQRRGELQLYNEQVEGMQKLIEEALTNTDDSKAADLEILAPAAQKSDGTSLLSIKKKARKVLRHSKARHHFEDEDALSFLAIDETFSQEPALEEAEAVGAAIPEPAFQGAEQPESLVEFLSKGVAQLEQQGKDSELHLKEMFLSSFEAGLKRHKALTEQTKVLGETLARMTSYEEKLKAADEHLMVTKVSIDKRIHNVGLHLQQLASFALAPPEEAAETFKALKALIRTKAAETASTQ